MKKTLGKILTSIVGASIAIGFLTPRGFAAAEQWWTNYQQTDALAAQKKYGEAEKLLQGTLAQARQSAPNDPRLVQYLVRYGAMLYQQKKFSQAQGPLTEAVGMLEKLPAGKQPPARTCYGAYTNLAGCLIQVNRLPDAEKYAQKGITVYESHKSELGAPSGKYIYEFMAQTLTTEHKLNEAKTWTEKAKHL